MTKFEEEREGERVPRFLEIVATDDASESVIEAIVDEAIGDEGLFSGLSLTKLALAPRRIEERLFKSKLTRFLVELRKGVSSEEQQAFRRAYLGNAETAARVDASLWIALERLDALDKAELLARATATLIRGEIELFRFSELVTAIDRCFLADLSYLDQCLDGPSTFDETSAQRLLGCGLVVLASVPAIYVQGEAENQYRITPFGRDFVVHVLRGRGIRRAVTHR